MILSVVKFPNIVMTKKKMMRQWKSKTSEKAGWPYMATLNGGKVLMLLHQNQPYIAISEVQGIKEWIKE